MSKSPRDIITLKTIEFAKVFEADSRAYNSALTKEQLAVINCAAVSEAIIWYLDEMYNITMSKRSKT